MLALQLGLTLALLAVCAFIPGFFFIRRLRWSPMEKLCGSVGLSLILVYLVFFAVHAFAPGMEAAVSYGFSALSIVLIFFTRKDSVELFQSFRIRQVMKGFSFLLFWA